VRGLNEAFAHIEENTTYKAVILTGYDNYFSCGGTKEELMSIHNKQMAFNDLRFFTKPLDCSIPVISAMQGHGIGGGFVFGCYSDFIILGRENIYTTNFMKYGFTPGMGGTCIVPYRLGTVLGHEMLYTAENFRGGQLEERGVMQKVVPKNEVLNEAIHLARMLADKVRHSLVTLKEHLNRDLKARIPQIIEQELKMHEATFHQPEVKQRIEALFGK
jgi:polyketide biosynthesis enoyl-CoA hydratase PksI